MNPLLTSLSVQKILHYPRSSSSLLREDLQINHKPFAGKDEGSYIAVLSLRTSDTVSQTEQRLMYLESAGPVTGFIMGSMGSRVDNQ